ncbi:keratinocyte differentiation factor 1 [Tyto alba]|uniref:keratinocyte differentiation factor 1 n=1 Tax=Tyto alba TaxID=56313 RepID=UPI00140375E4|nr:keratinocyte differentiation factor 1 [Tyto alba]XP_042649824.1 keratinocyte differentiation factor 1 [Tyto alba]
MLSQKTGLPHNLNSHRQSYQEAVPLRTRASKETDVSLEVFSGSTPEIKQSCTRAQQMRDRKGRKADLKDSNGREAETITFISGTAEAPPNQSFCCSSLSQAWNTYKAVFCCIVTCGGCFQDCSVCIPYPGPTETSTDDGKNGDYNGRLPNSPANVSPTEKNGNQIKKSSMGSSFSYPDVKLKGIPVYQNRSPSHHLESDSCCKELLPEKPFRNSIEKPPLPSSHRSSEEYYSFHESDLDISELNGSMSSREIDVLIFKKLTELFSVHQIDELAKCTSDTVFLEKTNKISDLINSITQDYNLDEQDAECRLVRGIIRISTRKSRVRPHISLPASQSHEKSSRGNAPDSGNETMLESMVISQDDLAVQISEETPADVIARNMRRHSSAGSPTSRDSSFQDTETDSSGAPLLQVYC